MRHRLLSSRPRVVVYSACIVIVAVLLAACGGAKTPSAGLGSTSSSVPAEAAFCKSWLDAFPKGDETQLNSVLAGAPSSLRDLATRALAEESSSGSGGDQATRELLRWVETHCHPDVGASGDAANRRLAPPSGSVGGLQLCSAGTTPSVGGATNDNVVLYGRTGSSDPYDSPMLGVVTGGWDHKGDGDKTPVRVRGVDGVAAPITVFQQVIPEGLGTVIAWEEREMPIGLYGRFLDSSHVADLVSLADKLEFANGRFEFPKDAVPDGYSEVFSGSSDNLGLVLPVSGVYEVRYQSPGAEGGLLTLDGWVGSQAEFEEFRFFALKLDERKLGDRDAIVGNAWHENGPAVVTWREPDGLIVRIVGLSVDLDK